MSKEGKFDLSNRLFAILTVFVIAAAGFAVFSAISAWQGVSGDYPREISVEATGKAYVVPDIAEITLGLDVKSDVADQAVEQNSQTMNKVMAALTKLGIEEKDIKTSYYNLGPNYEYNSNGSEQKGYILNHSVVVKVRDFDQVGEVIAKSTEAGANIFGGVQFSVDDIESAKTLAREEAIAKAKEKAKEIAKQSGLSLGKVLNFYEYQDGGMYGKGGFYAESAVMSAPVADIAVTAPTINPGEQEISLTVTLTYRVR
ncbi:SIMPL domain-containing protein [Candidatus Gracilibacteria bacterium]|nr:SIMPL domain-containing protein [Candidatus Gracilibacteria bacterium]